MRTEPYLDRLDAGQQLAEELRHYAGRHDVRILALPRGGVPVAAAVAEALNAPLDVLIVRKLGLPGHPELAMGAIAGTGGEVEIVRNESVLASSAVSEEAFDRVYRHELAEWQRRAELYRGSRPPTAIRGTVTILIDDGLATGSTMRAAVRATGSQQPRRLVIAVPAGARETCESLAAEVDELVCPMTPEPFFAVGYAYRNFSQTTDDEVRRILEAAAANAVRPPAASAWRPPPGSPRQPPKH